MPLLLLRKHMLIIVMIMVLVLVMAMAMLLMVLGDAALAMTVEMWSRWW